MIYLNKSWLLNQIEYIDNVWAKVEKLVEHFRLAKESGFFQPQERNQSWDPTSACRYCPMRNAQVAEEYGLDVCLMKMDCSNIDWEWIIEF
jgi:hypothetical protein